MYLKIFNILFTLFIKIYSKSLTYTKIYPLEIFKGMENAVRYVSPQEDTVVEVSPYLIAILLVHGMAVALTLGIRKKRKTSQPATHTNEANHARQICSGGSIRPYSK